MMVIARIIMMIAVLCGSVALGAGPPTPGGPPPPPPGAPPGVPPDYQPDQGATPPEKPAPPAMAFQACEGKAPGDRAQFQAKDGRTISGQCIEFKGRLVLRPDLPPPSHGAPPRTRATPGP